MPFGRELERTRMRITWSSLPLLLPLMVRALAPLMFLAVGTRGEGLRLAGEEEFEAER